MTSNNRFIVQLGMGKDQHIIILYIETSAKTGENVEEVFKKLTQSMIKQDFNK